MTVKDRSTFDYLVSANKLPDHVLAMYNDCKVGSGSSGRKRSLIVETLACVAAGNTAFDSEFFQSTVELTEENNDRFEKEWMPYKLFADREGDAVAQAQMLSGAVLSRVHHNLVNDTTIKWPHNQVIRNIRHVETEVTGKKKTLKSVATKDGPEAAKAFTDIVNSFTGDTGSVVQGMGHQPPLQVASDPPKVQIVEPSTASSAGDGQPVPQSTREATAAKITTLEQKDKLTKFLGAVKTAHRAFDDKRVDYELVVAQSEASTMVSETLLKLFQEKINTAKAVDKQLCDIDKENRQGLEVNMLTGKQVIDSLYVCMKECAAVITKIKPLLA